MLYLEKDVSFVFVFVLLLYLLLLVLLVCNLVVACLIGFLSCLLVVVYIPDKNNIVAALGWFGTIPVLIIGFSQLIFGFNESLRIFKAIVWHLLDSANLLDCFTTETYVLPAAASFLFCCCNTFSDSFKGGCVEEACRFARAIFGISAMILSNLERCWIVNFRLIRHDCRYFFGESVDW